MSDEMTGVPYEEMVSIAFFYELAYKILGNNDSEKAMVDAIEYVDVARKIVSGFIAPTWLTRCQKHLTEAHAELDKNGDRTASEFHIRMACMSMDAAVDVDRARRFES